MKLEFPDIDKFERVVFKEKNPLKYFLSFSFRLMKAREAGLLFGTDKTHKQFLPPGRWDRGIMDKFNGRGYAGFLLKYFGTFMVKYKELSPVRLYKDTQFGEKEPTDGIISFVLRTHKDFYKKGMKILIIDIDDKFSKLGDEQFEVPVIAYNGDQFKTLPDLKVNNSIVRQFKARNFVSAYIPDYGAIVFNTIKDDLLITTELTNKNQVKSQLKKRLDILISAIEMTSLAHIVQAKGKKTAYIIRRKEEHIRKTARQLKERAVELKKQKQYLKAVGAVNERQLNMEAVNITDGVYAFIDMVGSAILRKHFKPRDYFYILNLCHQIAANNASRYSCRVDNFMGDGVFLVNASVFDDEKRNPSMGLDERAMLMTFTIASTFNEIDLLQKGCHHLDKEGRVKKMVEEAQSKISFRAGMETGSAMIGPLGSQERKIVTAIGKTVNNASRLESSGIAQKIHVSETIMNILKEACITRNKKDIWDIVSKLKSLEKLNSSGSMIFFDCYKTLYELGGEVIENKDNVAYKEFSQDLTFCIQCIPVSRSNCK